MDEDNGAPNDEGVPRTGVNDHVWEREHRHPVPAQARAIGRRDAEAKLDQHQLLALRKALE